MADGSVVAGLTIEDVNEMQDAMNKIGDDDADRAAADAAKAAEDAAKLAEAKAAEDAAKADADAKAAKEKEEKGSKAKDEDTVDTVRELREQLRQNNELLQKSVSDYQKLHKIMVDKGVITDEELTASKAEEEAAKAAYTERQNKLTEMVSIMELNPAYADVREVCSQGNLDDLIDAFARYYTKENGGDLQETAMKMEREIWAEPNPYKKIYELVKKYHPKYAEKPAAKGETEEQKAAREAKEAAEKIAAEADKVKEKKAVETTPSAANLGAGGSGAGATGWTAARIDALDEDELGTVPRDIYDKYLKGTLK